MPRSVVRLRLDPFLIVCLILGLFLFAPLHAPGLPQAPDGFLHYYRSVLWRWAWNDGNVWPRWSTLLFQGYGYPVFNFNGPLPYLLAALASLMLPSVLAGFKLMLLFACLAYACGMYLWAREVLGPVPGIVAAAAYTFATIRFREWGAAPLNAVVHVVDPSEAKPAEHLAVQFSDNIALVGYETERTSEGINGVLYWRSGQQPSKDYQVFLHVLDGQGAQIAGRDRPPLDGLYPTGLWAAGQVIVDRHFVPLPAAGQPASLRVGLYSVSTLRRLDIVNAGGAANQDNAVVLPAANRHSGAPGGE